MNNHDLRDAQRLREIHPQLESLFLKFQSLAEHFMYKSHYYAEHGDEADKKADLFADAFAWSSAAHIVSCIIPEKRNHFNKYGPGFLEPDTVAVARRLNKRLSGLGTAYYYLTTLRDQREKQLESAYDDTSKRRHSTYVSIYDSALRDLLDIKL